MGLKKTWFIIGWLVVYVLESIFSVQASFGRCKYFQLPFQDPRLEVLTIYKAYISGLCKGISPQFIWPYMVQYLHFRILKFPLILGITGITGTPFSDLEKSFGLVSELFSVQILDCQCLVGGFNLPLVGNILLIMVNINGHDDG